MKKEKHQYSDRWICNWPDGSRAAVFGAQTVEDAIDVLDEIGPAEPWMLTRIDDGSPCFVDFDPVKELGFKEFNAGYISEELYMEVKKRRKIKNAPVHPISAEAAKMADALDLSVTTANRIMAERDYKREKAMGVKVQ